MEDKNELEKRIQEWKDKGKKESEITYGMLNEGFTSLGGIPDDFYSAEDPEDRIRLWNERSSYRQNRGPNGEWRNPCMNYSRD